MRQRDDEADDAQEPSRLLINAQDLPVRHQLATIRVWLRICYHDAGLGPLWFPERPIMGAEA
jgi:hypothetical protein